MPPSLLFQGALLATGVVVGTGATFLALSPSAKKQQAIPVVVETVPASLNAGSILSAGTGRGLAFGGGASMIGKEDYALGIPSSTSDHLRRRAYVAAYDRRLQHPAWTAEHLTLASFKPDPILSLPPTGTSLSAPNGGGKVSRDKSRFEEDESIPELWRAKLKDYFKSGYDRGHMVPAADAKTSQIAMNETFLLSNIAPQVGDGFNRHYWAYLEDFSRKLTNQFSDVYVFTIPLYLPAKCSDGKWRVTHEVIGNPPSISVPTHFSKVILTSRPPKGVHPSSTDQREISMAGFVLPNAVIPDQASLESFLVPVEQIEKYSGLSLVNSDLKRLARPLCRETKCEVTVRRFDDQKKKVLEAAGPRAIAGR